MKSVHLRFAFRMLVAFALPAFGAPRLPAAQSPAPSPARVLLLYSIAPDGLYLNAFTHELRTAVREHASSPIQFYEELVEADSLLNGNYQSRLARELEDKYTDQLDVVVVHGALALEFTARYLSPRLPDVPVVYGLVIEPRIDVTRLPPTFSGRRGTLPFAETLELARALQPDAKRAVIVGGASARDSVAIAQAVRAVGRSMPSYVLQNLAPPELLTRLRALQPNTIVLLADFRNEAQGGSPTAQEFTEHVVNESAAPVYSVFRSWMSEGIVGGVMPNPRTEGRRTAELVLRTLRAGWPALSGGVHEVTPNAPVVDWRQLQRWRLPASRLPVGTEVLFRTPSLWQRYSTVVVLIGALLIAQSVLIALLLLERRRRMQAQAKLAERAAAEHMIVQLKADALRYAHEGAPDAIESALSRIAQFAGAGSATLVQYSGSNARVAGTWKQDDSQDSDAHSRLDIPLVADNKSVGALELRRGEGHWPDDLATRLEPAAEVIAATVARSHAEQAVRRGEALSRAVLASVATPIAIVDKAGTIVRVNEAWRDVADSAGLSASYKAFVGKNYLAECMRARQRGCAEAYEVELALRSVLRGHGRRFRREYLMSTPEKRWFEVLIDPLDDRDGGAVVTHLDITDRRLWELRVEESRRQVAHLGRVAVVGELAAAISHELRQPLMAIRANAEAGVMLLAKTPDDIAEVQEIFRDIVASDARAADVIDNVRQLLRNEYTPPRQVDMNEICRQAVHLLEGDALLKHVRLSLVSEAALPAVIGDAVQLQQVVLNLVLNGLDAAAGGSYGRTVEIATAARDHFVEVSVRDTGAGLPNDVHNLFDPFFTTKPHGLGMGLAIVRSIVERHAGRVQAANHEDGGAVFTVQLPIV